jgi:hypothetical protein
MYISNGKKLERENFKPREEIIFGVVAILVGIFLYNSLNSIEVNGGQMKINLILYFIYKNFGKDFASLPFILFGIYKIISGILNYNNIKKWKEIDAEKNKEKFISIGEGKDYKVVRNVSEKLISYLESLDLEQKEGQIYMHYWSVNSIAEKANDQNYLNQTKYFWKADESFANKSLPENFENFQQRNFIFTTSKINNIKTDETIKTAEKFYYEENNQIVLIETLLEKGLIEYCIIEDLDEDNIGDMKYYEKDYCVLIVNPNVKYAGNEFYIEEEIISFEIAYCIGAIEIIRKMEHGILNNIADIH